MQTNLGNLLRVRARLVERLYGIHKLHANYGRVFSEWSAKEKEMGDGLQVFLCQILLYVSSPFTGLNMTYSYGNSNGNV
jgi:hypothetical protein